MRRYSIFHPLVLSFFSKSLYRDVGRNWRGTGLLYLLVVLALVWIPTMIKGHLDMSRWVDGDSKELTKQIPAITISNGQVSTDVTTPHFIKDPKTGMDIVIIDTTGEYETLENTDAKFLLTKSKVIVSKSAGRTEAYDLSGVQSFYVDRSLVESWLITVRHWLFLVLYPLALIFSFIIRAIQVLIYAVIGLLFARILHANLNFKTLMRLAAIAITPVLNPRSPLRIRARTYSGVVSCRYHHRARLSIPRRQSECRTRRRARVSTTSGLSDCDALSGKLSPLQMFLLTNRTLLPV